MAFDATGGEDGERFRCKACRLPIGLDQPMKRVEFGEGMRDLTGFYHAGCDRPFVQLARVMTMLSWR